MIITGTNKADVLHGPDEPNYIYGLDGNDTLYGGSLFDELDGGAGADLMVGGAGSNLYLVDNPGDRVVANVTGAADAVTALVSWIATPGSEIEQVSAGGYDEPLNLTGNLHSDSYSLRMLGNAGINTLNDGGGRAEMDGGYGNDVYIVTNALTTVNEPDGAGPPHAMQPPDPLAAGYDTIKTTLADYTLPYAVEVLTFVGNGAFHGVGNEESNLINGGAGNDTLDGGAGVDRLVGGGGDDTYYFDDARDFAVEQPGGGIDEIRTTVSAVASANVEKLTFIGTTSFSGYANATGTAVTGGSLADKIWGGAGADVLDGGSGSDKLVVGPDGSMNYSFGTDVLFGGAGADTFVFHPVSSAGVNRVIDFTPGTDHIKIDDPFFFPGNFAFTMTEPTPPDPTGGGHNISQILFYDQSHGRLYYIDGTDFSGYEKLIATFDNRPVLHAGDFAFA